MIREILSQIVAMCTSEYDGENYERLIQDLLNTNRHDKKVRPVENPSAPINISIALALHYIENLVNDQCSK